MHSLLLADIDSNAQQYQRIKYYYNQYYLQIDTDRNSFLNAALWP